MRIVGAVDISEARRCGPGTQYQAPDAVLRVHARRMGAS